MEIKQMVYFKEIVKQGSFVRAATSLALTQPALSLQISKLEKELKQKLFIRGAREITLTDKGRIFLEHSESILENINRCLGDMRSNLSVLSGNFRITTGGTILLWLMKQILKPLIQNYPNLSISLQEGDATKTLISLESGSADVGFLTGPVKSNKLTVREFLVDRILPVLNKNHPLAKMTKVSSKDLETENFIFYHSESAIRRLIEKKWKKETLGVLPKPIMELESVESLRSAIELGLGFGFLSEAHITEKMFVIPISSWYTERILYICRRKNADKRILDFEQLLISLKYQSNLGDGF
ncbi:LysR family transcriptional regulator [Leptospira sp. 96542]|nr:LysR family transcriptional regulator [Leptospira sp. 96542]